MTPWIQVYSNLPNHPKTYALVEELGLKTNYEAVGIIVCVWSWVAANSPTGDISDFPPRAIAGAVDWRKKPEKLVEALVKTGFLDRGQDGRVTVHDWEEYAVLLMETIDRQKAKTAGRVRRYREGKGTKKEGKCNVTVTLPVTPCNGPTRPDQTIPDLTIPNIPAPEGAGMEAGGGANDAIHTPKEPGTEPAPGSAFTAFWNAYPTNRGGRDPAYKAWKDLAPDVKTARCILEALEIFKVSAGWTKEDGRYIPSAEKFILERRWEKPPVITQAAPQTGQRKLDADEQAAVRRMLNG